jgi:hypothetical protein
MASVWIIRRGQRHRVMYRVGGRESSPRYGGSFKTKREANLRLAWIANELASMRVPDLATLKEPERCETLREVASRWVESRKDVRETTALQHPHVAESCEPAAR